MYAYIENLCKAVYFAVKEAILKDPQITNLATVVFCTYTTKATAKSNSGIFKQGDDSARIQRGSWISEDKFTVWFSIKTRPDLRKEHYFIVPVTVPGDRLVHLFPKQKEDPAYQKVSSFHAKLGGKSVGGTSKEDIAWASGNRPTKSARLIKTKQIMNGGTGIDAPGAILPIDSEDYYRFTLPGHNHRISVYPSQRDRALVPDMPQKLDCHNIYQYLAATLSIKAQNSAHV